MSEGDSVPMALVWIESLDRAGVPYQQYDELYQRSVALRAQRSAQGLKTDDFSVDLMIACWPSLKTELNERAIAEGRTLSATAPTQCLRCFGTGMERMFDENGNEKGVRPGCLHEHVDTSDPGTAGLQDALAAARQGESARDILIRLGALAAADWLTLSGPAADRVWRGIGILTRAERYVRETAGQ